MDRMIDEPAGRQDDDRVQTTNLARSCFASGVDPEGNPWCSLIAGHGGACKWGQQTDVAPTPERALAEVFCSLDASWNHHDLTDDFPCSACRIVARTHLSAARDDERQRLTAVVEAVLAHDDECGGGYVKAAVRTALYGYNPPAHYAELPGGDA